ncbi:uncharacterized protein LOC142179248 [Nicotiana tabacum]|uniref:Uncharacterized protein LOC142179248 n=1 Tax=Nicotiana tabacum TaxID=4097 RepID=A0AC58U6F1_TOBAC
MSNFKRPFCGNKQLDTLNLVDLICTHYMGKSLHQGFARIISSNRLHLTTSHQVKSTSRIRPSISSPETPKSKGVAGEWSEQRLKIKSKMEEESSNSNFKSLAEQRRHPLADVVGECVKRWFQDSLKEAKAGDATMHVLVGQMYYSGYGIPRDPQKGRAWISRASKSKSSAWKVSDKRPGYNVSDSDFDDTVEETK